MHRPDPRLDFTSPFFDAAAALAHPTLRPPVPSAPALDNVAACRVLLPEGHPAAVPAGGRPRATAAPRRAAQRPRQPPRTRLLDDIASDAGGSGPLTPLMAAYTAKGRVRVTTRHARGVRGVAVGTLAAFDRHVNLVLTNATEEYAVRLPVERERPGVGANGEPRTPRRCHKLDPRTRRLATVFVRGDAVVAVSLV